MLTVLGPGTVLGPPAQGHAATQLGSARGAAPVHARGEVELLVPGADWRWKSVPINHAVGENHSKVLLPFTPRET